MKNKEPESSPLPSKVEEPDFDGPLAMVDHYQKLSRYWENEAAKWENKFRALDAQFKSSPDSPLNPKDKSVTDSGIDNKNATMKNMEIRPAGEWGRIGNMRVSGDAAKEELWTFISLEVVNLNSTESSHGNEYPPCVYTEFRLVVDVDGSAYIHVLGKDSRTLNFQIASSVSQEFIERNKLNDSPLNPSGPKVKKRYACRLDEQGCMEECHGNPELKEKCEFCTVTVTDSQELNPSGVDLEESQHWQSFCDELQVGVQRILRDQGAASIEVRNAINDTLTSIIPMFDLTRKKGL